MPRSSTLHALPPPPAVLRARLLGIERELDAGAYRPGPWAVLIGEVKRLPREERAALGAEITRVSRKLHLRKRRRVMSAAGALMLEFLAIIIGMVLLAAGIVRHSNPATIIGALLWTIALQPVIKILTGGLFGIDYEYAYLAIIEPRFKMVYGSYIAASRRGRVITHLSGMIGAPLGMLAGCLVADTERSLAPAQGFCWTVLWIVIATNLAGLLLALAGWRRLGPLKLSLGSGGSAGIELREDSAP